MASFEEYRLSEVLFDSIDEFWPYSIHNVQGYFKHPFFQHNSIFAADPGFIHARRQTLLMYAYRDSVSIEPNSKKSINHLQAPIDGLFNLAYSLLHALVLFLENADHVPRFGGLNPVAMSTTPHGRFSAA